MTYRILIVEDETDIALPLAANLKDDGFFAEIACSAEVARQKLTHHWDLIILDLMLPDLGGEVFLNYLKQEPDYPSVMVVSAKSSLEDKLQLFKLGCDDYLTKPFIYEELRERVRALLRRSVRVRKEKLIYGDLFLDPDTFKMQWGDQEILLTPKEASILKLFLTLPGKVISRKEILENVWGLREEPETNFLGVHLFHLRKKLADLGLGNWLQTVRCSGFLFAKPGEVNHGA